MKVEENLLLIKGEDKTERVIYCTYESGKRLVTFDNNKTYAYSFSNVDWFTNPVEIDIEDSIVYKNNNPINGVVRVLKFEGYIRIFFKTGFHRVYEASSIRIEKSSFKDKKSKNRFEYLKELADNVSVTLEDDVSFLSKQYEKIKAISTNSVLHLYLTGQKSKSRSYKQQIIFPFGFNLSQKAATENSLTNQISVIEGPPGTGKTQTILNIIANAIMEDKTVAVVSNNNSATANVLEKLDRYGIGFIAAYLGNKENKERFFDSQCEDYPDMKDWKLEYDEIQKLNNTLSSNEVKLKDLLEKQNKIAKLKEELGELSTEVEYFNKYYEENHFYIEPYKSIFYNSSNALMYLLIHYEMTIAKYGRFKLRHKIRNLLMYGITSFKFYNNSHEEIVDYMKKSYYDMKLVELNKAIDELENKLEGLNFKELMDEYSDISMKLFKHNLAKRFFGREKRGRYSKDILWKNFEEFSRKYPIVLSTTHSLKSSASENYLFDYVIVDEASQVDIVTGALALSCAKNAVIVGDLKQLPNVVPTEIEEITSKIFKHYDLPEAYNYSENSLLSSITKLYEDVPKTLLKEHYRCHPKIIGFCNKKFYDNELIILKDEDEEDKPLAVYKTVKGNHTRGTLNQRQIDVIKEEVIPNLKVQEKANDIGIISPYRKQVKKLREDINDEKIEVDTIHKYQGREKETVILSTVSEEINDFIDDPNLINVAVSRAKENLILVVSEGNAEPKDSNIGDLIKYIQYNNFEIIDSKVFSVFDLLYKGYAERLAKVLKENKKVSNFDSENLMNMVIEKVLAKEEFKSLDKVVHQPLRMLIKDTSKLTEEEIKFTNNILTHTDFLIFNKIDKMPVLVVEVDGYAYHANNEKQLKRDRMKDGILRKCGIDILRMGTNESGEKKRLEEKLTEIIEGKN